MESLNQSNIPHYDEIRVMYERLLGELNNMEQAINKVTKYLIENHFGPELFDLQKEIIGKREKFRDRHYTQQSHDVTVVGLIIKCVSLYSKDIAEMKKITELLNAKNYEEGFQVAKGLSLQTKQRAQVFTTLAKLFLVTENFPKVEEAIVEIGSDEKRGELFDYLKILKKTPRDFAGYATQMKLGIENSDFESTSKILIQKLKSLSLSELEGLTQKDFDPQTYEGKTHTLIKNIIHIKKSET